MLTTLQGEERDHHTSVIYYKVRKLDMAVAELKKKLHPAAKTNKILTTS